jgi:hypothetical protein
VFVVPFLNEEASIYSWNFGGYFGFDLFFGCHVMPPWLVTASIVAYYFVSYKFHLIQTCFIF